MSVPAPVKEDHETQRKSGISFLAVFAVSLLVLLALLGLTEFLARIQQTEPTQPIRSVGNFQTQFETKWFKLHDYVKTNGGVDVILMGNSMVNTGVNPDVIAQEYEAKTGVKLRIFNFGVEGMDIQTNAELAGLLVEQYHPKAILFFTEMREYGPQTDNTVYEGYKHAAWFQYKLGNPSLEGWFFDHSAAMQYFLPYRNWSRADFPDKILSDLYRYHQTLPMGYEPDMGIGKSIDLIPNPDDPAQQYLYDLYADFKPDQNSLAALESILMLHKEGVQVLVTEMPAYESFYEYFGGESVHQEFIKTISALTTEKDGFYIPPIDPGLIPLNGRVDNHHLNYKGTQIYSELLSDELSGLCLDGKTCLANEAAQ